MIDVLITTDLEFSIGGAFAYPEKYRPLGKEYAWLEKGQQSLGLGFILETLNQHELPGVFFTEACNVAYHGADEMGNIVHKLVKTGHDVQLHLHPGWLHYHPKGQWPKNDRCYGRTTDELTDIFKYGLHVFQDWLGTSPNAVRAGSLRVDREFYAAIKNAKIASSSSICMPIFKPDAPELHAYAGTTSINGVVEFPVTTIVSSILGKDRYRPLQILSCSSKEITAALIYAEKNSISPIVILTHCFEYVRASNFRYSQYIANPITRQRLKKLCQYLSANRDRFQVRTTNDLLESLKHHKPTALYAPPAVSASKVITRMLENRISDAFLDLKLKIS